MKVAILVAGDNRKYFPLFFNKPKCLYHQNGIVQLKKVIQSTLNVVDEKDIIVVGGYKYKKIVKFLDKEFPNVCFKLNKKYKDSAIYSLRKAIENENDDFLFLLGDESISLKNIKLLCSSDRKLAILYHDNFYYYSLGVFKLRKDCLSILNNDKYLDLEEIKKIYRFANKGLEYNGDFSINSGISLGYITIDIVTSIGKITKIENPTSYNGDEITFVHYDPRKEYINDLDNIGMTDEYKNNFFLKVYNKFFSNPVKHLLYTLKIWKE